MSFILDALKKSESERQRQAGPALMEVRIAAPRNRLPLWALLVGALLLLNIVVLGAVLVFRDRTAPGPGPAPTPTPTQAAPVAAPAVQPLPAVRTPPPEPPPESLPEPGGAPAINPADYVPALPAGTTALPAREAPEQTDLPSRDDMVAAGQQLPELRLSLHVYDPAPASRYVLINSSRLREGESMADGMRLERITESGVVMQWRGQRFRLQRGE